MKTGLIYKVTNKSNGMNYIGQTTQVMNKRWLAHLSVSRNGKGNALGRAIRKYGKEQFTVTAIVDNVPYIFLSSFEKYWIHYYGTFKGKEYNCTEGGEGTLGRIPWNKGVPCTDAVKAKISKANKGKMPSNLERCLR